MFIHTHFIPLWSGSDDMPTLNPIYEQIKIQNSSVDTANDLDFIVTDSFWLTMYNVAGELRQFLIPAGTITKRRDALFIEGTNQGGANVADADGEWFCYACGKENGTIDFRLVYNELEPFNTNPPTSFPWARRIWWNKVGGLAPTGTWDSFIQEGTYIRWHFTSDGSMDTSTDVTANKNVNGSLLFDAVADVLCKSGQVASGQTPPGTAFLPTDSTLTPFTNSAETSGTRVSMRSYWTISDQIINHSVVKPIKLINSQIRIETSGSWSNIDKYPSATALRINLITLQMSR